MHAIMSYKKFLTSHTSPSWRYGFSARLWCFDIIIHHFLQSNFTTFHRLERKWSKLWNHFLVLLFPVVVTRLLNNKLFNKRLTIWPLLFIWSLGSAYGAYERAHANRLSLEHNRRFMLWNSPSFWRFLIDWIFVFMTSSTSLANFNRYQSNSRHRNTYCIMIRMAQQRMPRLDVHSHSYFHILHFRKEEEPSFMNVSHSLSEHFLKLSINFKPA